MRNFRILMVEDEPAYAAGINDILKLEGYEVKWVKSAEEALEALKWRPFDLLLTDLMLPGMDGTKLLVEAKSQSPEMQLLMMTAYGTIETAVKAMKAGASGYYVKGTDLDELMKEVAGCYEIWSQQQALSEVDSETVLNLLNTKNKAFQKVVDQASKAAKSQASILLLGESGVGKEVMAHFIHEASKRNGAFVAVNCQALSEQLLESELFGHMKGAFTGAIEDRKGRFEIAHGGTVMLDEIADVSLATQVKLLRVIELKQVERIGSNKTELVDFRLIAATNKPVETMVATGEFREDFFYRISTVVLKIPPLRKRKEDLPALIAHFLSKSAQAMGMPLCQITDEAMAMLTAYDYPGNIRELKNLIERLVIFQENGKINEELVSQCLPEKAIDSSAEDEQRRLYRMSLRDYRAEAEKVYIKKQLGRHSYHLTQTAEAMGITRRQLFNKMKALGIESDEEEA